MTAVMYKVPDLERSPVRDSAPDQRALAIWPRLDRRALARCHHDPRRIAALVSRRTSMPIESILALLLISDLDRETWFG